MIPSFVMLLKQSFSPVTIMIRDHYSMPTGYWIPTLLPRSIQNLHHFITSFLTLCDKNYACINARKNLFL